jgi:hypothetical protein
MIYVSWSLLLRGVFVLQPRFISSERSPPHDWYESDLVVCHWLCSLFLWIFVAIDFVVSAKTKELMFSHQLFCSRFNRISSYLGC